MKTSLILLAALGSLGFAQTAPRPAFEAADIHASAKVTNPGIRGPTVRGERYTVRNATLLDLVTAAYGVQQDRVQGGRRSSMSSGASRSINSPPRPYGASPRSAVKSDWVATATMPETS